MTPLERRCAWLLLAYPAVYRKVRGEEMLDTLLESTPADRSWPLPRDRRAMIVGGLQVRTAQNRRLSTAANLRLAATLGCVLYLSYFFYRYAGLLLLDLGAGLEPLTQSYPELAFAAGLLACTVVLVVRPAGRNAAVATTFAVAVLIAGTAAVVISNPLTASMVEILALLVLAALAVLTRGSERLPRLWLRLPGLVVAVTLLAPVATAVRIPDYFTLLRAPTYIWAIAAVLAFACIVIDARPAIGVAIFFGLTASDRLISSWQAFSLPRSELPAVERELLLGSAWSIAWKLLAAALLLAVLSSPRLRRQAGL